MLPIKLKMKGVWKIHLFGLFYPRLTQKADPNHVGGGEKRSCEVCRPVNYTTLPILKEETPKRLLI